MVVRKTTGKKTATTGKKTSSRGKTQIAAITLDDYLNRVRRRAYEIYQGRGGVHGNDLDDWLKAEKEVKKQYGI